MLQYSITLQILPGYIRTGRSIGAGCDQRRALPYHRMLLNGQLPLTIGGGIGQSRLCMLMIGCCHIGEVQVSLWDQDTATICEAAGVHLL